MSPSAPSLDALAWPGEHLHQGLPLLARAAGFVAPTRRGTGPGDPGGPRSGEHDSGEREWQGRGRRGIDPWCAETGREPGQRREPAAPLDHAGGGAGHEPRALRTWLDRAGAQLELEVESIAASYGEIPAALPAVGPAILRAGDDRFWLLVGEHRSWMPRLRPRRTLCLLGPDGRIHRRDSTSLADRLRASSDDGVRAELESTLERLAVPARRRDRALDSLLATTLADRSAWLGWLLRGAPHTPLLGPPARAGIVARLAALLVAHGLQYLLFLASWWLLGRALFGGSMDPGHWLGWLLALATVVPLRAASAWLMGDLAIRIGGALRVRLLHGALSLDPDRARTEGAGVALGRLMEAETVEALAMGGGLSVLTASIELPIAAWVLSRGASGGSLSALLGGMLVLLGLGLWQYGRRLYRSTRSRVDMTHDLVETMVGHRTRLAQARRVEPPLPQGRGDEQEALDEQEFDEQAFDEQAFDEHAADEQAQLAEYLDRLARRDRVDQALEILPHAWLLVALALLGPAWLAAPSLGQAQGPSLALALGGILLVRQALATLVTGSVSLAGAAVGWHMVAPLMHAGSRAPELGLPSLSASEENPGSDARDEDGEDDTRDEDDEDGEARAPVLLRTANLAFCYPGHERNVFSGCGLEIRDGDRLLVEGPSGGGKSTLAALLAGLRLPSSGLLTLRGLDRGSVGFEHWRRRVVLVPQFHDNHVLTGTFAFNLLLGRRWPPSAADLAEARQVCLELGLGDLLERMPAGLEQSVGDTGWRLSHGERGRLFLARALLQEPDLLILDESFAALDPETLQQTLDCTLRRSRTLVVIAHP